MKEPKPWHLADPGENVTLTLGRLLSCLSQCLRVQRGHGNLEPDKGKALARHYCPLFDEVWLKGRKSPVLGSLRPCLDHLIFPSLFLVWIQALENRTSHLSLWTWSRPLPDIVLAHSLQAWLLISIIQGPIGTGHTNIPCSFPVPQGKEDRAFPTI